MNGMKRTGAALVLLIAVMGSGACRDQSQPAVSAQQAASPSAASGPAAAPQPRMRSLKVADGDGAPPAAQIEPSAPSVLGRNSNVTQSSTGAANQQVVNVRSAPRNVHVRQEGGSNTQILNVEAAGGNVTQRQSGSGNFQSMNIGLTDNPPVPSVPSKP